MAKGEIPESIQYMLDNIEVVTAPDQGNEVVKQAYDRLSNHQCMLCGAELGEETMLSINRFGIFGIACGGACYTDLPVMHWIQERHEDMVRDIAFRGGTVDPDAPAQEDPPASPA